MLKVETWAFASEVYGLSKPTATAKSLMLKFAKVQEIATKQQSNRGKWSLHWAIKTHASEFMGCMCTKLYI